MPVRSRVILLLLAGGFTSIVVAWVGATTAPRTHDEDSYTRTLSHAESLAIWSAYAPAAWAPPHRTGPVDSVRDEAHSFIASHRRVSGGDLSMRMVAEVEMGFPFRCLRGARVFDWDTDALVRRGVFAHPVDPNIDLPCLPIWTGLIGDTLVYAGLIALLLTPLTGVRYLVGVRRHRRGLCPGCRYPIGDSVVCTECGREVDRRHG